jgi:hypothetical protein
MGDAIMEVGSRAAASKCRRRAPGLCCVDGLLRQCVDVTRPDLLRRRVDGQNSVLDVLAITILTVENVARLFWRTKVKGLAQPCLHPFLSLKEKCGGF